MKAIRLRRMSVGELFSLYLDISINHTVHAEEKLQKGEL